MNSATKDRHKEDLNIPESKADREIDVDTALGIWKGFAPIFLKGVSNWRIWYAVIYAVVSIIGNCAPVFVPSLSNLNVSRVTPTLMAYALLSLLYIVMSIAAVPILWWGFERALRPTRLYTPPTGKLPAIEHKYKFTYRAFVYVFTPLISLATLMAFSQLTSLFLPTFSQSQQLNVGHTVWMQVGTALLACLEELWRWSMILCVLLLARAFNRKGWTSSVMYPSVAFGVAIVVSSLFFGLGHVAEFSHFKVGALFILGADGVILAFTTIVTRRLWIAMVSHFLYDLLAITGWASIFAIYVYTLAFIGLVVVYPLFERQFGRLRDHSGPNPDGFNA